MCWRLKKCVVKNVIGWRVSMMVEVCFVLGRCVTFFCSANMCPFGWNKCC